MLLCSCSRSYMSYTFLLSILGRFVHLKCLMPHAECSHWMISYYTTKNGIEIFLLPFLFTKWFDIFIVGALLVRYINAINYHKQTLTKWGYVCTKTYCMTNLGLFFIDPQWRPKINILKQLKIVQLNEGLIAWAIGNLYTAKPLYIYERFLLRKIFHIFINISSKYNFFYRNQIFKTNTRIHH